MNFDKIYNLKEKSSHRESSWDRKGGNRDAIHIGANQTKVLADIEGPGIIKKLYFGIIFQHPRDYRSAIIRIYWDNEFMDKFEHELPLSSRHTPGPPSFLFSMQFAIPMTRALARAHRSKDRDRNR